MDKTMMKFKWEGWKRKKKEEFNSACVDIHVWWDNNKEWAVVVIPVAVGFSAKAFKIISKIVGHRMKTKELEKFYNRQIYDPVARVHLLTNRPMTAADKKAFAELRAQKYSVHDSLEYLGLL